ncbi:MAG TPA: TldD/PmbA family protein, partial [Vicinamibacteria bacterium]|nr:TldD/PmbA family protein [Vicinamibacteria bacterium]
VTVRKGEVETLTDAGSRGLGLRVFVGRRTANVHTSDLSGPALGALVAQAVELARATGEDDAAGLPDECPPLEPLDLDLFDPALAALPTEDRIALARRAEEAATAAPGITNSFGASYGSGETLLVLANTRGFSGSYRRTSVSLSTVPVAERDGAMERDQWYTAASFLADLEAPEAVGRKAAERTLRRLGARKIPTCEVPVVFDPETAQELLGALFDAVSGDAIFRDSSFLKDRLGEQVASPLITLVDDGRRRRGLGARPFDGEGLATRRNVPVENGVLRYYLCDAYSARKLGTRPTASARRGLGGDPGVGSMDLCFAPGDTSPEEIVAGVERGLLVTDLMGFGVDLVSGDYSQGAFGYWIEKGRVTHPVHEVTIAGNLAQMLLDVDAVGNDLVFRGSSAAPTLRIARMTVSGS